MEVTRVFERTTGLQCFRGHQKLLALHHELRSKVIQEPPGCGGFVSVQLLWPRTHNNRGMLVLMCTFCLAFHVGCAQKDVGRVPEGQ